MNQLSRISKDLFGDFFNEYPSLGYLIRPLHGDSLPNNFNIDISENTKTYTVRAELPGVKKEDINIKIEGKLLTISAEIKQADQKQQDDKLIRSECYYGSVSRSFSLPQEIDQSLSDAQYENGILTLTLTKKSGAEVSQIKIR